MSRGREVEELRIRLEMAGQIAALAEALRDLIPYAESRAEDLEDIEGREGESYCKADCAVERAREALLQFTAAHGKG